MLLSKHAHKDIIDLLRDENLFISTLEDNINSRIYSNYSDAVGVMTPTLQALHHELKVSASNP